MRQLEVALADKDHQLAVALADREHQLAESLKDKARHRQLADALADRSRQLEEALADRTRELADKACQLEDKERQLAVSRAREAELAVEIRALHRRDVQEETSQLARQLAESVQLSHQLESQLERAEHDRAVILGTLLPLLADHGLQTNPSSARDVATSLKRLVLELHARAAPAAAIATRGVPALGGATGLSSAGVTTLGAQPHAAGVPLGLPPLAPAPRSEQGRGGSNSGLEILGEGAPWGGPSAGGLGRGGERLEGGHYSAPFGSVPTTQRWGRGALQAGSEAGGNSLGSFPHSASNGTTDYNSNAIARTTPSAPVGNRGVVFDSLGQPRDGAVYSSTPAVCSHTAGTVQQSHASSAPVLHLGEAAGAPASHYSGHLGQGQGVGAGVGVQGAPPAGTQGVGGGAGGVLDQTQGVAYEERVGTRGEGLPLERTRSDLASREEPQSQR